MGARLSLKFGYSQPGAHIMIEVGEMMTLFRAEDVEAWARSLFGMAREHGFDQVLFGIVPSKHAKLESAFVSSNYSPEWRAHYDAEKLAYVDPTVGHCLNSSMAVVWRPDTFQTTRQKEMYEEASAHGIRSGVTLPIHGPNGEFGVLSFVNDARPDGAFVREVEACLPALSMIRDYAFASSVRFASEREVPEVAPRLTRRELEVLNWVMVGKSSWEISKITRCSEATVNFHIGNIRQKFNVNTRQQALVKAISMGILTPEDPHR
jgi:LuxR family quorum-sensing transcriptional regulator LasR